MPASAAFFHSVSPSSSSAGKNSSHCFGVISRGSPWKRRVGGSSQPQIGSWLQWQPALPEGMRYLQWCLQKPEREGGGATYIILSLRLPRDPQTGLHLPIASFFSQLGLGLLEASIVLLSRALYFEARFLSESFPTVDWINSQNSFVSFPILPFSSIGRELSL